MARGRKKEHKLRLQLDEAQRIVDQAEAGRLDVGDDEVRHIVEDAHARVTRSLVWGAADAPARRRTVQVIIATAVFVAIGLIALIVPLALGLLGGQ